jgi:hypothetical protein
MNIFKLDLLTLLISLFLFSACQKPNSVGLVVNPQDAVNGFFTSSIAISTTTVIDNDPISTNALGKYPVGALTDPLFGTTTSNLLMSLNLPSNNLTFGTAPQLDSAVLVLNYSNEYHGDPNAQFTFDVYQLANRLVSTSNLYNTNNTAQSGIVIGTKTCKINLNSSNVSGVKPIVAGVAGTPVTLPSHIRIPINSSFINTNFLNAPATNFLSNDSFDDFIRGLYLKATPATGTGGIVFFDLITGGSKLELYYHNAADATVKYVAFPIQATNANPSVAAFSHDFAGTEVQTQLSNPSTAYNYTFVQPMAGVRTQVNFPDLSPLKAQGNITINKAELVVSTYPVSSGNDPTIFTPAPRLYLYRTDIAGQRQFVPDCNIADSRTLSDVNFGGFYSKNDGKYHFIITSYIQDLVNGKSKQNNTYISVADSTASRTSALRSSATTAKRVVIGSGTNSNSPYQMKLNVTYTKTN